MILYSQENIKKLFLNPYIDVEYYTEGIICRNRLNRITIAVKMQKSVFEKLETGTTFSELVTCLTDVGMDESQAQNTIKNLVQKGVIE